MLEEMPPMCCMACTPRGHVQQAPEDPRTRIVVTCRAENAERMVDMPKGSLPHSHQQRPAHRVSQHMAGGGPVEHTTGKR